MRVRAIMGQGGNISQRSEFCTGCQSAWIQCVVTSEPFKFNVLVNFNACLCGVRLQNEPAFPCYCEHKALYDYTYWLLKEVQYLTQYHQL